MRFSFSAFCFGWTIASLFSLNQVPPAHAESYTIPTNGKTVNAFCEFHSYESGIFNEEGIECQSDGKSVVGGAFGLSSFQYWGETRFFWLSVPYAHDRSSFNWDGFMRNWQGLKVATEGRVLRIEGNTIHVVHTSLPTSVWSDRFYCQLAEPTDGRTRDQILDNLTQDQKITIVGEFNGSKSLFSPYFRIENCEVNPSFL